MPGSQVFYLRGSLWKGPATVIFQDGHFMMLRDGAQIIRCSSARVASRKYCQELKDDNPPSVTGRLLEDITADRSADRPGQMDDGQDQPQHSQNSYQTTTDSNSRMVVKHPEPLHTRRDMGGAGVSRPVGGGRPVRKGHTPRGGVPFTTETELEELPHTTAEIVGQKMAQILPDDGLSTDSMDSGGEKSSEGAGITDDAPVSNDSSERSATSSGYEADRSSSSTPNPDQVEGPEYPGEGAVGNITTRRALDTDTSSGADDNREDRAVQPVDQGEALMEDLPGAGLTNDEIRYRTSINPLMIDGTTGNTKVSAQSVLDDMDGPNTDVEVPKSRRQRRLPAAPGSEEAAARDKRNQENQDLLEETQEASRKAKQDETSLHRASDEIHCRLPLNPLIMTGSPGNQANQPSFVDPNNAVLNPFDAFAEVPKDQECVVLESGERDPVVTEIHRTIDEIQYRYDPQQYMMDHGTGNMAAEPSFHNVPEAEDDIDVLTEVLDLRGEDEQYWTRGQRDEPPAGQPSHGDDWNRVGMFASPRRERKQVDKDAWAKTPIMQKVKKSRKAAYDIPTDQDIQPTSATKRDRPDSDEDFVPGSMATPVSPVVKPPAKKKKKTAAASAKNRAQQDQVIQFGYHEACTVCDGVMTIKSMVKHVNKQHGKGAMEPLNNVLPVRTCKQPQLQLKPGQIIKTGVNGSKRSLQVLCQAEEGSPSYYNYYNLLTLDGEKCLRINLEEQAWELIKDVEPSNPETCYMTMVPRHMWHEEQVMKAKQTELDKLEQ